MPSVADGDWYFPGSVRAAQFILSSGCVGDANVIAGAAIGADKLIHRLAMTHRQQAGTAVVARTEVVHCSVGAGTLAAVKAVLETIPTSSDTVTIDVQKSTLGGAFATVLTSTIQFTSGGSTVRVVKSGTILTSAYVAGDIFRVVVTVSGSSAQSLNVTLHFNEASI